MRKKAKIIFLWIFALCLCTCFFRASAATTYTISSYQIHADIDKSAVMKVEENITFKDCPSMTFEKDILQDYSYDADQDGTPEIYAYEISSIRVEGADYTTSYENGAHRLRLTLEKPNANIIIHYQVRFRRYDAEDANIFYYQLISPNHSGTIESFNASITLPNRPDTGFDVYQVDQGLNRSSSLNASIIDKTIQITSLQALKAGQGIMVFATLKNFFFNYSHPLTLHLFFSIFSIILVMGCYFGIIHSNRFHKKDMLKESYPIKEIEIGSLGYILDGIVDEADIISILIEWANQNYIQIRDENQTIALVIINELPQNARPYEQHLFDLIFTQYTMVTIDQLKERNLKKQMLAIEKEILAAQEQQKKKPIYANTSYLWQILSIPAICIPLALTMFACIYEQQYQFSKSLRYAFSCAGIIYVNCLPWVWLFKKRSQLSKSTQDVYRVLTMLINFITGALLYRYLLMNQTPVVYAAINFVLTLLFACIIIFMDRRTFYGRNLYLRLLSLRQYIRTANSEQLTTYLYDNPYYFEDMLPYAWIFDITDIWGKKFTSIPLDAPVWYFHANADAQSTIYWMRALDGSLNTIKNALYYEADSKKKSKLFQKDSKNKDSKNKKTAMNKPYDYQKLSNK